MNIKVKNYIFLHFSLFIYSIATVFSKLASNNDFFSLEFLFLYIISIFLLLGYAILWQQNLRKFPLTIAFANKSIVLIWGILWGALLFGEKISLGMIIGAITIFLGIRMVASDE